MSDVSVEQHIITTRDKKSLTASLYRPIASNGTAVLIAPAMGVKQSYYRHYASFLAEKGFIVLSFDYRGVGLSLNGNLWAYEANLLQWGAEDLQAMMAWLLRHYPNHKLAVVGHSIGTKIVGLSRSNQHVKSLLGISSGNIYWRLWPLYKQPLLFIFWYILVPLSIYAMGYFPANIFGLGEELPRGVGHDWARMAKNRYSVLSMYGGSENDHFADFTGYFNLYTFSDDNFLPKRAGDELLNYYPNAQNKQHRRINPASIGQKAIGHLGFFRPNMRDSLWEESANWLCEPQSQSHLEAVEIMSPLRNNEVTQTG